MFINRLPLGSNIAIKRFLTILNKVRTINSVNGVAVEGKIISTNNLIKPTKTVKLLQQLSGSIKIINVKCTPNLDGIPSKDKEEEWLNTDYNYKREYDILVFTEGDFVVPAILVADSNKDPYLLFSVLSTSVETPIPNNDDELFTSFRVVPINLSIMSNMENKLGEPSSLFRLYQSITDYYLYDVNIHRRYKYKQYIREVLNKFQFNTKVFDILDEYISIPLIDVAVSEDLSMDISKAAVIDGTKIKLDNSKNNVVVLEDIPKVNYSLLCYDLSSFVPMNGCMYDCNVIKGNDLIATAEGYTMGKVIGVEKGNRPYETYGIFNIATFTNDIPESFYESFNLLCNDYNDNITLEGKKETANTLINFTLNELINKEVCVNGNNVFKFPKIINKLSKTVAESYNKEELKKYIGDNIDTNVVSNYENGYFHNVLYLLKLKSYL